MPRCQTRAHSALAAAFAAALVLACCVHQSAAQFDWMRMGVVPFMPLTNCTLGDSVSLKTVLALQNAYKTPSFTGYEIDLITTIAQNLEWDLTKAILYCVDDDSMFQGLSNGTFFMGFGNQRISADVLSGGEFTYSYPFLSSGLSVVVKATPKTNIFDFFDPFDVFLWIVIALTALIAGFATWIFEDETFQCSADRRCLRNYLEMTWQTFSMLFYAHDVRPQKFSARVIFVAFWFVILIVTASYKADVANISLSKPYTSAYATLQDVRAASAATVYTFSNYTDLLSQADSDKFQGALTTIPRLATTLPQLVDAFRADASEENVLLIDTPLAQYLTAQYTCSCALMKDRAAHFGVAFVFNVNNLEDYYAPINTQIGALRESSLGVYLRRKYLDVAPLESDCNLPRDALDLRQLGGLWIILAVIMVVAIIVDRISYFMEAAAEQRRRELIAKMVIVSDQSDEQARKDLLDSYLKISDYIHIPSKTVHEKVQDNIKTSVDRIEQMIKERFSQTEMRVLEIIKKHSTKKTTLVQEIPDEGEQQDDDQ